MFWGTMLLLLGSYMISAKGLFSNEVPKCISVTSLMDAPANYSFCVPSENTEYSCNLRSALDYCALSVNPNSPCAICLPYQSAIPIMSSLGPIHLNSISGNISVNGNDSTVFLLDDNEAALDASFLTVHGALSNPGGRLEIVMTTISGFRSSSPGGGSLSIYNMGAVLLTNVTVRECVGVTGGALYVTGTDVVLVQECQFLDNHASLGELFKRSPTNAISHFAIRWRVDIHR